MEQTKEINEKPKNKPVKEWRSKNFTMAVFHNPSKKWQGKYRIIVELNKLYNIGKTKSKRQDRIRFDVSEIGRVDTLIQMLKLYIYINPKKPPKTI